MKSSLVVWLKLCAKHCSLFCSSLNILWSAIKTVNALETASDLIPNKNKMQITKLIFHTYPKCITHLPPLCPTKSPYESGNAIKLIVSYFILSFLIFVSCCTNWHLISLAHRLTADFISHPGCSLGVLISEPPRFIFILANSVVAHLNFTNLSTNFPENHVYIHACVCVSVYICTFLQHQKGWWFFFQA